jgi:hypothetical protein
MRKILWSLLVVLFSVCGVSWVFAQETDQNLWGIWKLTDQYAPDYNIFMIFTPNGSWGSQNIEGLFYGRYAANGSYLVVNATIEYSDIGKWDQTFQYQVMGNNLHLSDDSGTFQDYVKVTTFTGFGFIHCPSTVVSNMFVGSYGHVAYTDGRASRERSAPGTSAKVIAQLPEGAIFLVVGEPQCANDITWWPINDNPYNPGTPGSNNIVTGWIGEGENGVAYIEPIGWIDRSILRTTTPSESDVVQNLASQTGAQVYSPGTYKHIEEAARAFVDGTTGDRLSKVMTILQNGYLVVVKADLPNISNPVEVVCTAATLSDFGIIPDTGSEPVLVCAFMDEVSYIKIAGPVAGSLFFIAQQLLTPGKVIDPYIVDPINIWADSRPITRFACWVSQGKICPQ